MRSSRVTRRSVLKTAAGLGLARCAFPQGMVSRNVQAQPRGKPSGLPFDARFTDIAQRAGLREPLTYGGIEHKRYPLEAVGCGCAFIDYDNDGWIDIFLLSGSRLDGSAKGASNRLYKNNRDGTFSDVTAKAGLLRSGWASAVCVGDYNNDGFDDLFITYYGQNVLYRNNGDGTFSDVTRQAGLIHPDSRWGSGCAFLDYNRDGWLDLFVANYFDFDLQHAPEFGSSVYCSWQGVPVHCGPRGFPTLPLSLFRNNGDGTFADVSASSGIAKDHRGYAMTVAAADFDNDGWTDIFVACDSTPSFLFHNNHDGTFTDVGLESGVAVNEDGVEQAGMGVAAGDYLPNGNLDILKTHFTDDTSILYKNLGDGRFEDVTYQSGLGVETRFISWGAGMADLDNDGLPDLFIATGGIYPEVEARIPRYPMKTPRVVFRNLGGGRFEELLAEAGPAIAEPHASRGCAFGDFDNDGDIDVLIVNLNEPPSLLRNDTSGKNHWLKVKLIGTHSNRSAIGARVTARYGGRVQAQEVLSQSSFYSANDLRLHFGLGSETTADLEIRWPDGAKQTLTRVKANQILTVREPAAPRGN
ncbi:MAG: CRTAC1 family protein [Bryobacteraceae bacterium]